MKYLIVIIAIIATTSGQVLEGFECENPDIVTWNPHPFSCTRYVLCFYGNAIERLCAPGLHFSREFQHCTFPQLARCDYNYACPEEDDELNPVFLPDPKDCGSFFVCFKGEPIQRDCAENLWWDVIYNWCTVADEVTCDSRTPNNPNTPPPVEETTPATIAPTDPPTTYPPTTTPDPNTMDCPLGSDITFHPHSIFCDHYFICINGVAFLRQCAEGTIFDIIERKCYDEELSTCISGL